MHNITSGRSSLAIPLALSLISSGVFYSSPSVATGFITDSSLNGSIYYWQRQRDRKDLEPASDKYGQYQQNLHHSTFNGSLDFSSGLAADIIGLDLAVFSALEMAKDRKSVV